MFRKTTTFLFALLALGLATAPVALAQEGGAEAWRPKENFWWLFAAYAVIWVALFGYVARMAGKQQELERELARLTQGDAK